MPNLITKIPSRAVVCVYNCIGSRQSKHAIRGTNHGNERWGAVVILAQEKAYPLKVTIRHPYFSHTARFKDGAAGVNPNRRAAYQGDFNTGNVTRQAPQRGTLERRDMRGECAMTINGPDEFPAPSGPRFLPDKYPGGVSLVLHEVSDPPNGANDAREVHRCFAGCGKEALEVSDYCLDHDSAREVHQTCTHVEMTDNRPTPCQLLKVEGSEFCSDHQPRKATAPRKRRPAPRAKAKRKKKVAKPARAKGARKPTPRRARQEVAVELPDLGAAGG